MRIIFFNIAWMNYYKGVFPCQDEPKGGGSFVTVNGYAHEACNFMPMQKVSEESDGKTEEYCLGYVETKTNKKKGSRNQLHIERIEGCSLCVKEKYIDDVLVVFCATHPEFHDTYVVGWYNHARVYRDAQPFKIKGGEESYVQHAFATAPVADCVLLPRKERVHREWKIPRRATGISYGFGQANVWFATGREENENLNRFLKNIEENIKGYNGENWITEYPEKK